MKSLASLLDYLGTLFMNKKPRNYIKKKPNFDNTKHDGRDSSKIKKLKCFCCKRPKHLIKNYNKLIVIKIAKSTTKQDNVTIGSDKLYVVVLIIRNGKDPTLCLDIGATQHMVHDNNTLISYQTLNIGHVATPLWDKCEDETHTPKSGKLESSGTPENSELEFKGQNILH